MTVIAHPQPGTIVRVDLNEGFRPPEMIKRRPCIVLSPPLPDRPQLCAIVPLSTTPPRNMHAHHLEIPLDPPLPHPYGNRQMWVKADMVLTVAFHRLRAAFFAHRGWAARLRRACSRPSNVQRCTWLCEGGSRPLMLWLRCLRTTFVLSPVAPAFKSSFGWPLCAGDRKLALAPGKAPPWWGLFYIKRPALGPLAAPRGRLKRTIFDSPERPDLKPASRTGHQVVVRSVFWNRSADPAIAMQAQSGLVSHLIAFSTSRRIAAGRVS